MMNLKSYKYARRGITAAFNSERNIRIQVCMMSIVTGAGFYFSLSWMEWSLCILCFSAVISSELLNTSIEKAMDFVNKGHHPQIGMIKDIAAGAVLITALGSVGIASLIFIPKIYAMFD